MLRKKARKPNPLKVSTRSAVSKKPLRDPDHLARVRQNICLFCWAESGIQAHHIRECFPRTMGVRIGDDKTVPLCERCHTDLHKDSRHFWLFSHANIIQIAADFYARTLEAREADGAKPDTQRSGT